MSLNSIVKVTISKQTTTPTRAGFGFGAFVSEGAVFTELIKIYADISEVNTDVTAGLLDTTAQVAAQRYFGQANSPTRLYVIKKGADRVHVQSLEFSGEFVTGNVINLTINAGTPIAEPFLTDSDITLTNLAATIQADADVATAVADTATNKILITGATNNLEVAITALSVTGGASQPTPSVVLITAQDEVQTYVQSITRSQVVNDDWYMLAIQSKTKTDQEPVADAIEPLTKAFAYSTSDAAALDAADATDILSLLKAKTLERSLGMYSADSANHPEMGWLGGQLPKDPGSITWAFQTIAGAVVDVLTSTQKNAVLGKNGNTFTTTAGLNLTENGTVASGEFMDVVRGIDFITARMQEFIFALIANQEKIPFTDDGIASVENEMRAALQLGVGNAIITDDFTVTVPLAADVPAADKANRLLPDMKFNAKLAGAIHSTEIDGVVTL